MLCAYYAQALDLFRQVADPDPVLGNDLAIGLGIAQRQIGNPASRETLLGAARQAIELGDTNRLVAAALANNRGYTSNNNATDTDKVDVPWKLLAIVSPSITLTGRLCSPHCAQSSPTGVRSNGAGLLLTRR